MIHEIAPHKLHNAFRTQDPTPYDYFIRIRDNKILLKKTASNYTIPRIKDFPDLPCHYLIAIDGCAYFLDDSEDNAPISGSYEFVPNRILRTLGDRLERLGGSVAFHIAHWESLNKFCGHCGHTMERSKTERAMVCPHCNNTVYPRISPVVIVAVHNADKLLMARNLDHPDKSRLFLISGFVEIGESLEQAVHREVMEEAGINIKNVKYFGSQPWPFSDSLIAGFTAELDGDETLKIQESEIEIATWVQREDIPEYDTSVSISSCLIEDFRNKRKDPA
ncbi:MAG: NAD(+) diphosphatase [Fibrobacter sp.]|nr:NAD(+) diphosphatase [Fibrobacter sp.]